MKYIQFRIGRVTHYYDKIGVAVIRLEGQLSTGEKIKFVRGGEDQFEQIVDSIQIEHEHVDTAKTGTIVGIKTVDAVKEGAEVFKLL